jgi:hypothetical protein
MANLPRPRRRGVTVGEGQTTLVLEPQDTQTGATGVPGSSVQRGSRPVKEYYVYDSEFRELKRIGAFAALLFAIGSAAIGFSVNAHMGMAFAENVPAALKAEWTLYRNVGIGVAALCYLFGAIQALTGYNEVERIKAQTLHGDERYVRKPWYWLALGAIILIAALALGIVLGRVI